MKGSVINISLVALLALASSFAFAYDPSPQDFCVAVNDTKLGVLVNGRFCKDPNLVKAEDFFFHIMQGNTNNPLGSKVTQVSVNEFPALNTFGISLARIDYAPYGLNPPHIHPRPTEVLTVLEGFYICISLSWDPNYSCPSYASHPQITPDTLVHEEKPTIEDMIQRIFDSQNEMRAWQEKKLNDNVLALEILTLKASEMASTIESFNQEHGFIDISNDSSMKEDDSSEQLTMRNEEVLPMACDANCPVHLPILESTSCCLKDENREKIPTILTLDPSIDILTLNDESQVDFIGCSNYLVTSNVDFEELKLKSLICLNISCILKSFSIDGSCVTCLNEHLFWLKPCHVMRNEDKLILIFDTDD